MLSFIQKYRSKASDNDLMERAIVENQALVFLMDEKDAQILLRLFEPNFSAGEFDLTIGQILKLKLYKLWNSAFGNVADFIGHMGLERLSLSIEESEDSNEPRHVVKVTLVDGDES